MLITGAMGLIVLGLQQSSMWGWGSIATWACIVVGPRADARLRALGELSCSEPLLRLEIFRDRAFSVETLVLGLMSVVFVPFFFFASVYAQVSLGKTCVQRRPLHHVVLPRLRDHGPDRRAHARPARRADRRSSIGCALGAVGFFLLAGKLTDLSLGAQTWYIILAGGGLGLMLGPASTDARQPRAERELQRGHGHHPDRAQLRREPRARDPRHDPDHPQPHQRRAQLTKVGVPDNAAHRVARRSASRLSSQRQVPAHSEPHRVVHAVQLAFAHSTQTVFYIMAGVLGATLLIGLRWLPRTAHREQAAAPLPANEPAR